MYKANIKFASMRLWSASSSKVSKKTRLPKLHHQYASGQGIEMRPTSDQTTTHVASFLHLEVAHLLLEDMIRDGHVLFLHQFDSICQYHLRNVRCGWPFQYPWLHLQPQPTQTVITHNLKSCNHDLWLWNSITPNFLGLGSPNLGGSWPTKSLQPALH